jgi:hypothetical protein
MKQSRFIILVVILLFAGSFSAAAAQQKGPVHDSEYYIIEAQNAQKWAAEDKALDARLAELRKKYARPPNIIHFMWDDQPFGAVGIPALQQLRGFETPKLLVWPGNRLVLPPGATSSAA